MGLPLSHSLLKLPIHCFLHTLSSSLPVSSLSGVISAGTQITAGVIYEVPTVPPAEAVTSAAPSHIQSSSLPVISLSEATFPGTQETVGVVPEVSTVLPPIEPVASAASSHSLSSLPPVSSPSKSISTGTQAPFLEESTILYSQVLQSSAQMQEPTTP